jgi:hypothetical protein
MDQQPQEEKVNVVVAIARSRLDYGKVRELLEKHGPSVLLIIDKDPSANSWAVY